MEHFTMTNPMTPARVFTDSDWDAFAGAENFANGDRPVIRAIGDWVVIADRRGISATNFDTEENCYRNIEMSQAEGLIYLNGLPEDFHPAKLGFAKY
jgi:hypothetical protein